MRCVSYTISALDWEKNPLALLGEIYDEEFISCCTDCSRHLHTAGVPGRHELDDSQELNYRGIARTLAESEFDGYIAHEFIPTREPIGALRDAVDVCNV